MGREIKFRCWALAPSGDKYFMLSPEQTAVDFDYHHKDHEDGRSFLMQYTDLKDKNGVEVYEGDIIKVTVPEDDPEAESIQKVTMYDGFWKIELISSCHDYDMTSLHCAVFYDEHVIEVIGNIHENPELLKTTAQG